MDNSRIPALSIRQPWIELILAGEKRLEVRGWTTRHRGRFWLHASKTVDKGECERLGVTPATTGALVGSCELVRIFRFTAENWRSLAPWHHVTGDLPTKPIYGWYLTNAQRLETPIHTNGKLGLFYPEYRDITTL